MDYLYFQMAQVFKGALTWTTAGWQLLGVDEDVDLPQKSTGSSLLQLQACLGAQAAHPLAVHNLEGLAQLQIVHASRHNDGGSGPISLADYENLILDLFERTKYS